MSLCLILTAVAGRKSRGEFPGSHHGRVVPKLTQVSLNFLLGFYRVLPRNNGANDTQGFVEGIVHLVVLSGNGLTMNLLS